MNKQKRIRQEKGITLIALIITIVVLLILAVVTINSIQGDGIIEYAKNAADEYTAKADEEQESINTLLGQIEGSLSEEEKATWTKTSEGELAIGSTVKHIATNEEFYVIGFDGETVKLLAKDCINTKDLVQTSNPDNVVFCEDSVAGYWGTGTTPYDVEEKTQPIPTSHTAAYAADRYGAKLGVTGRLMLHNEAEELEARNSDILYGKNGKSSGELNYWLGSAVNIESLFFVRGEEGRFESAEFFKNDFCVRPVIEILSSKIS